MSNTSNSSNPNPASRLLQVITAFNHTSQGSVAIALAKHFDVPPNSPELLSRTADILMLVDNCVALVERIPNIDKGLYISTFQQVRVFFVPDRLNIDINQARTEVRQQHLATTLQFCASTFAQHGLVDSISEETFQSWHSHISSLIQQVAKNDSDASPIFRDYLLTLLQAFQSGLIAAKVQGACRMKDEVDLLIVRLAMLRKNASSEESGQTIVAKIEDAMAFLKTVDSALGEVLSIYDKGKKLIGFVGAAYLLVQGVNR